MTPTVVLQALLLLVAVAATKAQTAQNFSTSLADLPINPLQTLAIVAFPPCWVGVSQSNANLILVSKNSSGSSITNNQTVPVPPCRLRRDAVFSSDSSSGGTVITNIGFRVTNLTANTTYTASYQSNGVTIGLPTNFTTVQPTNYTAMPEVFARSGGMVVITVLLSIAMAILVIALILTFVMGRKK
ncbi:uroplakin-2 [Ambystoma mexicanum]|uniref:uroplakin-2 n=1 Tax=Ambystoma mexicanum TaxID=8296 RepID=UPI0037E800E6